MQRVGATRFFKAASCLVKAKEETRREASIDQWDRLPAASALDAGEVRPPASCSRHVDGAYQHPGCCKPDVLRAPLQTCVNEASARRCRAERCEWFLSLQRWSGLWHRPARVLQVVVRLIPERLGWRRYGHNKRRSSRPCLSRAGSFVLCRRRDRPPRRRPQGNSGWGQRWRRRRQ